MGRPIRDFRDLGAWQCAMDLAIACADVCAELPRFEAFVIEQLRHAANSVHASIAEGHGRPTTPDYLRYLGTARSSLNEVRSHLFYVERRYPNIAAVKVALDHAEKTSRPLQGLIKSLREKLYRERQRNSKTGEVNAQSAVARAK